MGFRDDDSGRPKCVKGQMGSAVAYYAGSPGSTIQYASHGAVSSMAMGDGITETWTHNSRLQATSIQVGSLLTIINCCQTSNARDGVGTTDVFESQRDPLEPHPIIAVSRNFTAVIFHFMECRIKSAPNP